MSMSTYSNPKNLDCQRRRRAAMSAEGRCINDTNARTHAPPVAGERRCPACKVIHQRSRGPGGR